MQVIRSNFGKTKKRLLTLSVNRRFFDIMLMQPTDH